MSNKKTPEEKIGSIAPFGLRMLPELKQRVEAAAQENNRSMNAEIVARLEQTFIGNLPDLSGEGFGALIKRLEATIAVSDDFVFGLRDTLPGLDKFMVEKGLNRQDAIRSILQEWLTSNGYGERGAR